MKVAFIHPDLGIGGAERLILDIAVALDQQGLEVLFLTNHFDPTHAFQELKQGKYQVHVFGDWLPRSIFGRFQAVCAYIRMLYLTVIYMILFRHQDKPDVFFVDQIPMANFILKLFQPKVIYYCHHPDLLATERETLLKRMYRAPIDYIEQVGTSLSDIILVNSQYTASVFYQTFPKIRKRIHVLYPTIASSYLEMLRKSTRKIIFELIPEVQYNRNDVVFLSINRYHPAKKLELAIQAMEILKGILSFGDWQRVHLVMVGGYDPQSMVNRECFDNLVKLSIKKNLNGKVVFLKSPSDSFKADLLLSCDCLLYTPVNEHFGIVPLEAMAAGKPVIACNSGGPCETVEDGVTGYLTEPRADKLAECMKKMLNKEMAKEMGSKGKLRLAANFSYETFSEQVGVVVLRAISMGARGSVDFDDSTNDFEDEDEEGEGGEDGVDEVAEVVDERSLEGCLIQVAPIHSISRATDENADVSHRKSSKAIPPNVDHPAVSKKDELPGCLENEGEGTASPAVTQASGGTPYSVGTPYSAGAPFSAGTPQSAVSQHSAGTPESAVSQHSAGTPHGAGTSHTVASPHSVDTPHRVDTPHSAATPHSAGTPYSTGTACSAVTPLSAGTPHSTATPEKSFMSTGSEVGDNTSDLFRSGVKDSDNENSNL